MEKNKLSGNIVVMQIVYDSMDNKIYKEFVSFYKSLTRHHVLFQTCKPARIFYFVTLHRKVDRGYV